MEKNNENQVNSRRKFLMNTCATACGLAGGFTLLSLLDSCKTSQVVTTETKDNRVSLPVTAFAEATFRLVRPLNSDYDIIIIKKSDTEYNAFQMRCTHKNAALNADQKGIECPKHGSNFDMEGNVTKGPADLPLTKYKTVVEKGKVIVLV